MLEIRYNKNTKELTGWWSSRLGNHDIKLKNRPDEAIATLDINTPDEPLDAWLFNKATQSLIPNPSYVEPMPPRNALTEIDNLRTRIEKLEGKTKE